MCAACTKQVEYNGDFSDGLPAPEKTENFNLSDEYGTKQIDTFYIDVNNDGVKDTIKRGRFVTGTAHSYTFYDIYLDNGEKLARLTTQESADCILRAYKFQMQPFVITSASRNVGADYIEPTKTKIEKFIYNTLEDKLRVDDVIKKLMAAKFAKNLIDKINSDTSIA